MMRLRYSPTDGESRQSRFGDEPVTILRLQVNGALISTDTLVTVDSTDPDATTPQANWGVATHLVPGDLLMVEPATDAATFTVEYVEVVQVISTTQFVVRRGQAGSTAASIADNVFLLKVGSSFPEGVSEPSATSRNPIKYNNFTQIFKTTYDITKTAAVTRTRTGDPLKNEKKRRSYDHARDIEFALLWGRKNETTGTNGKPKRTFDGIRRFIPSQNTTVFAGTPSFTGASNNFLDAVYKVFDWSTDAGDSRICICGNGALNALNKLAATDDNNTIFFDEKVSQYGMNLRTLILPQGTLYLRTHPLLNQHSLYTNSMFIMDFSALKWRFMKGRDTSMEDNIQQKGEDNIRGQWLTEGGLEFRWGGLSCGYLGHLNA